MNAFVDHHQDSIRFRYRCFDRLLLNGAIQPFQFQGKGLGTLLLERLAVMAERAGIRRFQATTLASNTQMLEVFRDSGFEIRSKLAGSAVDVEFTLASSVASVAAGEKRQRIATAASLRPLFEPQAVAVIGASRNPSNIGRRVLDSLIAAGYRGHVYPVNPHASEIAGLNAFGSARVLPAGVDLAVVAVPALSVGEVVDDCAAAGVKALVVVTAGFAEAGIEGRARQAQLLEKTRSYGMRIVGPNCMGLLNTDPGIRLNASFSAVFPPSGHIGLLSQSGALGLTILELAVARHLGRRRSSASATKPMCRATTCWSIGTRTRRRGSSCSIWSRSAIRAGSRALPAASDATSRSSR